MRLRQILRISDGNLTLWEYNRARILAIMGTMEQGLESVPEIFRDECCEFSGVLRNDSHGDEIYGVFFKPFVDFTMDRNSADGESTIVTFSLDEERSMGLIKKVVESGVFRPKSSTKDFIQEINRNVAVHTLAYDSAVTIAEQLGCDLDEPYSIIHYAQFLTYKGINQDIAINMATKRFGINL